MRYVVLFVAVAFSLGAQTGALPVGRSFLPEPGASLSPMDVARLAYQLGGGPTQGLEDFLRQVQRSLDFAERELGQIADPFEQGEALLAYLHRNLFRRYVEPQTRLNVLFRNGTFNCVSSSLAYLIHARHLGLHVGGVATRAHVFCILVLDDGRVIDVETTNVHGFDPGTKREFLDSFGRTTGYTYVPPGNYRDRTTIGERHLLGLLIQNLIVEKQNAGRMVESLQLAVDRVILEGQAANPEDFFQATNNVVAWHNGRRDYASGLELALEIRERYGEHPTLRASIPTLVSNLVNDSLRAARWDEARERLNLYRELLDDGHFLRLQASLEKAEIGHLINQDLLEEAGARLRATTLNAADRIELTAVLFGKEAQNLIPHGWEKVWRHLRGAPEELRRNTQFRNFLSTAENNFAIEIRNNFARLANGGDLEGAEAVLEKGIRVLGEHRILRQARAELNRVRRQ